MILTLIGAGKSHILPRVLLYKIKATLVTMEECNQCQKDLEYPWSILYFIYNIVCVYITIYGYQDMDPPGAVFCGGWPKMVALTGV